MEECMCPLRGCREPWNKGIYFWGIKVWNRGEQGHKGNLGNREHRMTCVFSELYYQPGHPQSLASLRRPSEVWILGYPWSAQRRLWSDWADVQADLIPFWAHRSFIFVTTDFNPFLPSGPSLLIGQVHFSFKGCLVYVFIFILFLIEIPVCKQCRPWVCTVCLGARMG